MFTNKLIETIDITSIERQKKKTRRIRKQSIKKEYNIWKKYSHTDDYIGRETTLTGRLQKCRARPGKKIKKNPKTSEKNAKSKLKNKPKLGDLQKQDGSLAQDDKMNMTY